MAYVTGGLGGLGMIAATEMSKIGNKDIITTSRTGRVGALHPELQIALNAMEQWSTHHRVQCDCSDGAAFIDSFNTFCQPRPAMFRDTMKLEHIMENLKQSMETMPEQVVGPTLALMEEIKAKLHQTKADHVACLDSGIEVSVDDLESLTDYDAEVSDLIDKLKQKADAGGPTTAALNDIRKACSRLGQTVDDYSDVVAKQNFEKCIEKVDMYRGPTDKIHMFIHSAGVLQDGFLRTMGDSLPEKFSIVFGPKAHAAWVHANMQPAMT